jgi:hypothetical protein
MSDPSPVPGPVSPVRRYDMVTNYRCGESIDELERADEGEWVRWEDVAAALQQVQRLEQEIADAREACPSIRRQDYFDAPLLKLIELEVSRGFNRDSEVYRLTQKLTAAQATIPHLQALVKSGDLKRVLDAAQQHANDEQAWRSVWGPAYFESNLGRCENRRKLRVAIQELAALLSAIPTPRE